MTDWLIWSTFTQSNHKPQLDRQRYEQLTASIDGAGAEADPVAGSLDLTTIRRVIDCNMEDYLRKVSLFRHVRWSVGLLVCLLYTRHGSARPPTKQHINTYATAPLL